MSKFRVLVPLVIATLAAAGGEQSPRIDWVAHTPLAVDGGGAGRSFALPAGLEGSFRAQDVLVLPSALGTVLATTNGVEPVCR